MESKRDGESKRDYRDGGGEMGISGGEGKMVMSERDGNGWEERNGWGE